MVEHHSLVAGHLLGLGMTATGAGNDGFKLNLLGDALSHSRNHQPSHL